MHGYWLSDVVPGKRLEGVRAHAVLALVSVGQARWEIDGVPGGISASLHAHE